MRLEPDIGETIVSWPKSLRGEMMPRVAAAAHKICRTSCAAVARGRSVHERGLPASNTTSISPEGKLQQPEVIARCH
ncbi:hypothetical protein F6P96_07705 [Escherichia coli]|nr:hypothetical protein F6P96_07705 [Escherichia coli]